MVLLDYMVFALALVASVLPSSYARPTSTCARRYWQAADCAERCKARWFISGSAMATDRWGLFKNSVTGDLDSYLKAACGLPANTSGSPSQPASGEAQVQESPVTPNTPAVSAVSSTPTPEPTPTTASSSSSTTITSDAVVFVSQTVLSSYTTTAIATPTLDGALAETSSPDPPASSTESPPSSSPSPTSAPSPSSPPSLPLPPASSSTPSNNNGGTADGDIAAYLSAHNDIRRQHGASDLTWSDSLAASAQQWANNCKFQHSGQTLGPFGENLAAGTGSNYGIAEAIKSWTDEASEYSSGNPQPSHFTQVVWKATTQVGCAVRSCDGIFGAEYGKAKFFVCEYLAQGNVIGNFAQNVQA